MLHEANRFERELGLSSRERKRGRNLRFRNEFLPPAERKNIFPKTGSSIYSDRPNNPYLHPHQSDSQKSVQDAHRIMTRYRRKERKSDKYWQNLRESVDLYDIVLDYLLDEGYCGSVENAKSMMAHMSEDWVESIIDERTNISYARKAITDVRRLLKQYPQGNKGDDYAHELKLAKAAFKNQVNQERKKRGGN